MYKEEIINMVRQITDQEYLRSIYLFVKRLLD